MKVYEWRGTFEGYASLSALDVNKVFAKMSSFDGRSYAEEWEPLEYIKYEEDKELPLGDNPNSVPGECIISKKALERINQNEKMNVEYLPVLIDGEEFYLINPLEILSCFDWEKAQYKTFRDGKRIMSIRKYAFIECEIGERYIFRLKGMQKNIFVTDRFVNLIEANGLKGFNFRLLWDSEQELNIGDV